MLVNFFGMHVVLFTIHFNVYLIYLSTLSVLYILFVIPNILIRFLFASLMHSLITLATTHSMHSNAFFFIAFGAILSLGINIMHSQTHYMGSFIFSKQVLSSSRKSTCIYRFTICRLACMFLLL